MAMSHALNATMTNPNFGQFSTPITNKIGSSALLVMLLLGIRYKEFI